MSLICDETGRDIIYGESLQVGTREDVEFYSALCEEVIARIPESERRPEPCVRGDGGVDIHRATSGKNFNGAYTLTVGFQIREFLFSVSKETAEKYIPKHLRHYNH